MKKAIVPIVPAGGNTSTPAVSQIAPSKRWIMVLNNYTPNDIEELVPKFQEYCKKYIVHK